jgi:hypothetical protein
LFDLSDALTSLNLPQSRRANPNFPSGLFILCQSL